MTEQSEASPFSPRLALTILLLAPAAAFLFFSNHQTVLAIFFVTLLLWFTEAVPLPVTALLVPILISLLGLLPTSEVFGPFGNDILFLFLGCFLMGLSMAKHGFDRRVAYWLLSRCLPSDSLFAINLVIAAASFTLSMWISNTAATAIMCAITVGILGSIREQLTDEKLFRVASIRLLLSCAFASSIGGLATPIGSPPNLIAVKYLSNIGISVGFLDWMRFGLPVSLLMFALLLVIFEVLYPIRGVQVEGARTYFRGALSSLGKMTAGEKQIATVFMLAIFFWIAPEVFKGAFPEVLWIAEVSKRLSMSVVGLLGGLLLFFLAVTGEDDKRPTPNLAWHETSGIEWGAILLFGGGLSLGNLLEQSGAARDFGAFVFQGGDLVLPALVGTIIVVSILLSEFASNTAAASIIIPLVIGVAQSAEASNSIIRMLVLTVAFSASFGFMLPVSTPPNAIVYGTGRIRGRDMMKTGMWFDILGGILIACFAAVGMYLV